MVPHDRDLAVGDRHIELPVNVVCGVNDAAALYDPVVFTHLVHPMLHSVPERDFI